MNICHLCGGHFEFWLVEGDADFKTAAYPSNIVIYVKMKPYAKFGTFVPPVTVMSNFDAKHPDYKGDLGGLLYVHICL